MLVVEHTTAVVAVLGAGWGAMRQAWRLATAVHELTGTVRALTVLYGDLRDRTARLEGKGG